MIEGPDVEKLRERYDVHPLIFHRSKERANDIGDLFDILEDIPVKFPIMWDEKEHRWKNVSELTRLKEFKKVTKGQEE